MSFRIKRIGGVYYTQRKFWFGWWTIQVNYYEDLAILSLQARIGALIDKSRGGTIVYYHSVSL